MENFNDYLFPFSLGCLDKEDKKSLKEFIEGGGDFSFQDLGEFQNLVSLLPSILSIETPDPKLKDDVARKLYSLKDEIKAKRNKNKPSLKTEEPQAEDSKSLTNEDPGYEISKEFDDLPLFDSARKEDESSGSKEDRFIPEENPEPIKTADEYIPEGVLELAQKEKSEKAIFKKEAQKSIRVEEDDAENIIRQQNPSHISVEKEMPKKNYSMMLIIFLLFFLVVIGITVGYWKLSTDVKEYKNDVDKLNRTINSLTMRLSSSQEIEQILQSPNVQIINLKGTNLNSSGYGKLIISPDKGIGYIQLAQMPALSDDKTFQLWISVSGNFMPLETFHAAEKMEYYSFKIPKLPQGYDVSFLVTEEPVGGSKTPGRNVYLTGNM